MLRWGGGCEVNEFKGCDGKEAFCRYCEACSVRCSLMGRMWVSWWRCRWLVSAVQPVATLSAVF